MTLDLTVGPRAGFWKQWRPKNLVTNDIDPKVDAHYHLDARNTGLPPSTFPQVVLDPPYAFRGTAKRGNGWDEIDNRYGTSEYRSVQQVMNLMRSCLFEAIRLSSRLVLLKLQDANVSSRYEPQSFAAYNWAAWCGAKLIGEMHVAGARAQPAGKVQRNLWTNHSTLMVFEVKK